MGLYPVERKSGIKELQQGLLKYVFHILIFNLPLKHRNKSMSFCKLVGLISGGAYNRKKYFVYR